MTRQDRVLIAHNDEVPRRELELLLRDHGYLVATAADCDGAIQQLGSFEPDLVILDLEHTPTEAVACCRKIKSSLHTEETKVVMLSASAERAAIGKALAAGCDDYIYTPLDELSILALVREQLQFLQLRQALRAI